MRGTRGAHGLGHVSSYYSPTPGHVSTFNSSTIDQPTAATSSPYGPVTCCVSLPRQPTHRMLTSSCATCHPSSGDTCHLRIGQPYAQKVQNCMTRGITWSHHVSCTDMPRMLYGPATCPVRTVRTGTVSIKFLPVWLGEQIAISSPYRLCLRK
jgi:hypothetical protein